MNPPPLQPPPISDEEVEQLLQQAESLVDTITDDTRAMAGDPVTSADEMVPEAIADPSTTVDPLDNPAWTVRDPIAEDVFSTDRFPAESAAESPAVDPLQAIAHTEAIADEITAILDEAADTALPPQAAASETPFADTVTARTVASKPSAGDAPSRAVLDDVVAELASGLAPNSARLEIYEDAPSDQVLCAEEQAPPNNSSPETRQPATRTPLKVRLFAIHRVAFLTLTAVPVAFVNLVLRLIVLLDRPFARFSAETKLRIGLVALATLFMGAAAWVLPRIAVQNPYAAMER